MKNLEKFTLKNNLTMYIKGGKDGDTTKTSISCCPDVIDPNIIKKPGYGSGK